MDEFENYNGIIDDPRTEDEKAQDYKHSDIYGGTVEWEKKEPKQYTPRNQSTSLSCCGQGSAKGVETIIGKIMSAHPPYRSRTNYPDGGMYLQDIGNVWKKFGSCLESEDQSQNQGESLLNRDITVETPYKIKGYLFPNSKNIDEIAQAIETWGHCMLIFHANGKEWKEKPMYNGDNVNFGHCVCAVDYFLDEDGNKCLWIEDSAGITTTIDGQHRTITEDYLVKRCDGAIYFLGVHPLEIPYKFTKLLRYGSRGYHVKKLQGFLNTQGFILKVDGIFGQLTESAVEKFQKDHQLIVDGIVGPKTNALLNNI